MFSSFCWPERHTHFLLLVSYHTYVRYLVPGMSFVYNTVITSRYFAAFALIIDLAEELQYNHIYNSYEASRSCPLNVI